jgi:predicted AlkP superfamily phosphohydrolase/phosphomutase
MAAHLAHRVDRVGLENAPIDWGRTMAYALDQHRLYLNLQGREPEGIVSPEAYDSVLSQIEADLSQLTDRAGRPLSTDFYRGRHLYSGPFVQEAPDLLVFLDGYHCDVNYRLGGERFMETSLRLSGTHHPEGLLMLWGKDVRAGHHLEANIVDIAPTIVHALGAPISSECDGQPIWEAFEKKSEYTQRPLRSKSFTAQPKEEHVWTEEEEAQVMERLRDLGYL